MGHYSHVSGTLTFTAPLTDEQVSAFLDYRDADDAPSGVEDWTLTADYSGIVSRWEDAFKAYDCAEGLGFILQHLKHEGIEWETSFFRRSGDGDPPDMEDWVVEEGSTKVEVQEPILVFAQDVFVGEFEDVLKAAEMAPEYAAEVAKLLKAHLSAWEEPNPDTAEAMEEDD